MVAFLAALPAIISAMSAATDLFGIGKKVVTDITGHPAQAKTVEAFEKELEHLPPAQLQTFITRMEGELSAYEQVTGRLRQDQGTLTAQTLTSLSPSERSYVARLRMTTRPWAVRWMVIAVVFPPLALVVINLGIAVLNIGIPLSLFTGPALPPLQMSGLFNDLYITMVGWASGVIMTYMGMREIGKARNKSDAFDPETAPNAGVSLNRLITAVKRLTQ